jgi:DNA-binding beta-propeller fold protein YncE
VGNDFFVVLRDTYGSDVIKLTIGSNIDDEEIVISFREVAEENFNGSWPSCAVFNGEHLLVTDELRNIISVFTPQGDLVKTIGAPGNGESQFNRPSGITIDSDNNVYVADTLNHRIQKFSPDLVFIQSWGELGETDGLLNAPWGICTDDDNFVYVADHKNHRIQKFNADGAFILSVGEFGSSASNLNHPSDVSTDKSGDIYVADWVNNRVQIYDSTGIHIAGLTGSAVELSKWQKQYVAASPDVHKARRRVPSLEPETLFALPTCVSFDDSKSRLLAVDSQRWRIQIFDKITNYSDPQFNI